MEPDDQIAAPAKKAVVAVAGVIERDGLVLIGRRLDDDSYGGFWEFPGGKIEPGESPEECLERELMEELGIRTAIGPELCVIEPSDTFKLIVHGATIIDGEPELREHSRLEWVTLDELDSFDLLPADRPVIRVLAERAQAGD
ncbi:MAG: (deoxy)nucleoside triphosphate pyrophosphohydrolase [Phycisphaerales bacterium]|nr:(deoxy)nucleoside triphosphate pyrophosphohydrolase [Phycisphaerales bacterium]